MRYKIFSERTGLKVSELALGTGMFGIPVLASRRRPPSSRNQTDTTHQATDRVEVWHLRDRSGATAGESYLVAQCECGWIGRAHDAIDTEAQGDAFAEAREHGPNVAAAVVHMLD